MRRPYQMTGLTFTTAMECGEFLRKEGFTLSSEGYTKTNEMGDRIDATFTLTMGRCFVSVREIKKFHIMNKIDPFDVLDYIAMAQGQENDAEEVRDFAQTMARLMDEEGTLQDAEKAGYGDFVDRLRVAVLREGKEHHYSVEEQVDKSWGLFCNGGWVTGGDKERCMLIAETCVASDLKHQIPVNQTITVIP